MTTTSTADILVLLDHDHRRIETLFAQIDSTVPDGRGGLFWQLVSELVRHEIAEEVVVYPAIRADAPHGNPEANFRINEQVETERLLIEMEKLRPNSLIFQMRFVDLRDAVLAHFRAEEENMLPLLRALEEDEILAAMGIRFEKVKAVAPTFPHSNASNLPPDNHFIVSIPALFDWTREAARKL